MKTIILMFVTITMVACTADNSENAKELINKSDYCLIYKYDTLHDNLLLFNIPSVDTIEYIKQILIFDGKFTDDKTISAEYQFDLITQDSLIGEVLLQTTSAPYLTVKSSELQVSRQMDCQLARYLEEIEQNVYSTRDSRTISFRKKDESSNKRCGFSKHPDSVNYTNLFITSYYDGVNEQKHDLESLIESFHVYWYVAEKYTEIQLSTASVGYPSEYNDILKRHIAAFKNSAAWNDYVDKNGNIPNYELTKSIMLDADVYKPLNDFLKAKGYEIADLGLEKIGYIDPKSLENAGLDNNIIIPVPHMVWINIGKSDGNSVNN